MKFSTRLISASVVALLSGASYAQSDARLYIASNVEMNCYIDARPTAKATTLDLVRGEENTEIAVVTETCNSPYGYRVTMRSENNGQLIARHERAEPVPYDLNYEEMRGRIADGMEAYRERAEFGRRLPLTINLRGNSQILAGHYADNIVITIAGK